MANNKKGEPFIHLTKRKRIGIGYSVLIRVCAILAAFLIITLFVKLTTKESLPKLGKFIISGTFGSSFSIIETFKDVAILLGIALALAPSFKMRFWNIGAQGQVLFGALCASFVIKLFADKINQNILLFLMFIAAAIGGAIWSLIPALFKVKLGSNETLFTLMMNYIAIQLICCFRDLWKGKNPSLPPFENGRISSLFNTTYGLTYLIIGVLTVFMFIYMAKTKHGYEITVVGESIKTAQYAGINTNLVIVRTICLSGAICGLIGFLYVGNVHTISDVADGGYGFTAIIVTWASHFNPFFMALISFAIVFLQKGCGGIVDNCSNISKDISAIVVGIFLFFLIGCEFFINFKLHFNIKKKGKTKESSIETEVKP